MHMPLSPELGILKQKDCHKLEANLDYRLCPKSHKRKMKPFIPILNDDVNTPIPFV